MPREVINPSSLFNSVQYGFSQISLARGSRIVSVSGQVGWDAEGKIVGAGDLRAQTMKSFENLALAMQAAGGTLDDIVALRIYIVAAVMSQSSAVSEGLRTFFPAAPPSSTWIGVPALANADFLIEIEALAVLA